MTQYYYLASDQALAAGNGSLEVAEAALESIPGFNFPVQKEIYNGVTKPWQLRELHQYVVNHLNRYEKCTIQLAHLLNSSKVDMRIDNETTITFEELGNPEILLLNEGRLLTIIKS